MLDIVTAMLPALKPGAVVTDVGSVKGCVHQSVGAVLTRAGVAFIGSHPMAGSEKQGMEHASAELFQGATCILTNDDTCMRMSFFCSRGFGSAAGCTASGCRPGGSLIPPWPHFPYSARSFRTMRSQRIGRR